MNGPSIADPAPPSFDPDGELLNCDLVMKGGITSGVVYPKAVVRLAQRYRIRSIGGTSVGAIAAALTAAAEYWRQTHPAAQGGQDERIAAVIAAMGASGWNSADPAVRAAEEALTGASNPDRTHGYAALYGIPHEIGSGLLGMFQPSGSTRGSFNYLVSILNVRTTGGKVIAAIMRGFYIIRAAVAVLTVLVVLTLLRQPALAFWIAALALVTVALVLLDSTIFSYVPSRPVTESPPTNKRIEIVVTVATIGVVLYLLLRSAFDWRSIFAGIRHQIDHHPVTAAAMLVAAAVVIGWKWIRESLVRLVPGAQRRQATAILDAISAVVVIVAIGVLAKKAHDTVRSGMGIAAVAFIVGWILGGLAALCFYLLVAIPRNFNGICTGQGNRKALTNWLTAKIDEVAGIDGHHVTFGDLQGHKIVFEAIASDLKRGVPLDVPRALAHYRFRPDEFARLFPRSVLRQLGVPDAAMASSDLAPFPAWTEVPVVVSARMSMSFPMLFSAVPVYHVSEGARPARPNWLSDGGIVSNFPLHKFDRALPPWPTFAIDLIEKEGPRPREMTDQIWLNLLRDGPDAALGSAQSTGAMLRHAQADVATGDLVGLASRILNTARGWMDNSQKTLPGYAERIVAIFLYPGEGGLNLDMDARTIRRLADRGMCAAHLLARAWEPFDEAGHWVPGNQWEEHRWLRYRLLMRELEQLAREWTWVYAPRSPSLTPVHHPPLDTLIAANGATSRRNLVYGWEQVAAASSGNDLTAWFNRFAAAAGGGIHMDAEVPGEANLDPQVFDQARAPALHPKRFLIPPFE